MATHPEDLIDLREQIARIDQMRANSDKLYAETQKMLADLRKSEVEVKFISVATAFQGLIAIAALLGAGAALAKLLLT